MRTEGRCATRSKIVPLRMSSRSPEVGEGSQIRMPHEAGHGPFIGYEDVETIARPIFGHHRSIPQEEAEFQGEDTVDMVEKTPQRLEASL
jgi:hypothetical protein